MSTLDSNLSAILEYTRRLRAGEFIASTEQLLALQSLFDTIPSDLVVLFGFFMDFELELDRNLVGIFHIESDSFEKIANGFPSPLRFVPSGPTCYDFLDEYVREFPGVLNSNEWSIQGTFLASPESDWNVLDQVRSSLVSSGFWVTEIVAELNRWLSKNEFCLFFAPNEPFRVAFFATQSNRKAIESYLVRAATSVRQCDGIAGHFLHGTL